MPSMTSHVADQAVSPALQRWATLAMAADMTAEATLLPLLVEASLVADEFRLGLRSRCKPVI